jgi:hypothetical protein
MCESNWDYEEQNVYETDPVSEEGLWVKTASKY